MKIRFPSDQRATWRRHFLEIARQAAAAPAPAFAAPSAARRPRLQASATASRPRNATAAR